MGFGLWYSKQLDNTFRKAEKKKKNVASFEGRNKTKKNVFCRLINVCFVPEQQQRSQHLCK